jgi:N-acetylglucosamine repressor
MAQQLNRFFEKATRQHTKDHNHRLVLHTIYHSEAISRAELARLTGLTRTTVSDVVTNLIERGLVEEVGQGVSSGGRIPILLRVVDDARYLIGVSFVNNKLTGAIINLRGVVLYQVRSEPLVDQAERLLAAMYSMIEHLHSRAEKPILGIGICTPGLMDVSARVIRRAVNYNWYDLELTELLQERYSLPVYMGNLAHMAALAEYTFGPQLATNNLVVIHVSHGIGAGIVLNGELFHGDSYGAGEIGHVVVDENGPLCKCGNYGCLEAVADTRAIVRRAHELAPHLPIESFDDVVALLASGEAFAQQIVAEVGRYFGIVVAQLVTILNVERVVISGPIAALGPQLQAVIQHEMSRRSLPTLAQSTTVDVLYAEEDQILRGISALILDEELGVIRFGSQRPQALLR